MQRIHEFSLLAKLKKLTLAMFPTLNMKEPLDIEIYKKKKIVFYV